METRESLIKKVEHILNLLKYTKYDLSSVACAIQDLASVTHDLTNKPEHKEKV